MRLSANYPDVLQSALYGDFQKGRRDYNGLATLGDRTIDVSFNPPQKGPVEADRWVSFINQYLKCLDESLDHSFDVAFDNIQALRADYGESEVRSVRESLSEHISLSHISLSYGVGYSLSCSILCAEYFCMDVWIYYDLHHRLIKFDVIGS